MNYYWLGLALALAIVIPFIYQYRITDGDYWFPLKAIAAVLMLPFGILAFIMLGIVSYVSRKITGRSLIGDIFGDDTPLEYYRIDKGQMSNEGD